MHFQMIFHRLFFARFQHDLHRPPAGSCWKRVCDTTRRLRNRIDSIFIESALVTWSLHPFDDDTGRDNPGETGNQVEQKFAQAVC